MIEDILDILRSSSTDWMDPDEVIDQLQQRDLVRYRRVTRQYVNFRIRKLQSQGYPIQTAQFWDEASGSWLLRIRMVEP